MTAEPLQFFDVDLFGNPILGDGRYREDKPNDTTLTPLPLVASLGVFDLDPCGFNGHPTATNVVTLPVDGLAEPWIGRVWLNPPYSSAAQWMERLAGHGNGVALVLASTDTAWYHDLVANRADAVLFLRGRPRFLRSDKTEVGLMRASLLVAYGAANADSLRLSGLAGHYVDIRRAARAPKTKNRIAID